MSTISASTTTTTAYKVTADTTGTLVLQTGASPTTAVTIDGSQNVGIGTSSPSGKLSVAVPDGSTNALYAERTGGAPVQFSLTFANQYSNLLSSGVMAFHTAGSQRAMIDSSGNLGVGLTSIPNAQGNSIAVGNTSGANINITCNGVAGSSGSPKYLDMRFLGYNNEERAKIRSWDEASTSGNGNLTFWTGIAGSTAERARIDSSGNLLVGAGSGTSKLYIYDPVDRTQSTAQVNIGGNGYSLFNYLDLTAAYIGQNSASRELRMYSGGTPTTGVKLTAGATSWASTSDETEKDIIEPISEAVQKLSGLRTVIGKYKTDDDGMRRSFLIAQDVKAVFPEAVSEDNEGILSLRYTDMIPVLVKAIQEQQALIQQLTARIETLEAK